MIRVRDVTLRDGLQDEARISTEEKILLFDALVNAGVRDLELTSFTRADRVPALADADRFSEVALARQNVAVLWGLVLNQRGAERALKVGLRHLQFVVSVSERHNLENTGHSVVDSLEGLRGIAALARDADAVLEVTLATAFGCPFDGPVQPATVFDAAQRAADIGVERFTLADTIGTAVPTEVGSLVTEAIHLLHPVELGVHLHNTRGLAIANALAALSAGATRFDGTVGGLGGCPFAPGASGNLVLDDLVHAFEGMGLETGIDLGLLLEASNLACSLTGHAQESHVAVAGPRFANVVAGVAN
ncbi:MAG TPA: hydroxymethylglutaryl-CoA lyase [Acidimicrobiales bacterium]|nr:hydroxymethylglutaryl-CoA lyase [Acidimicrobiales bacterium]